MKFNLYISTPVGKYNMFGLSQVTLEKVIEAYHLGRQAVTISGKKYSLEGLAALKIFEHNIENTPEEASHYYLSNINFRKKGGRGHYLPETTMQKMGKDVTYNFLGNLEFESKSLNNHNTTSSVKFFVNQSRLDQLIALKSEKFDLTRLIKLCDEINFNFNANNFLSVGMIARTIINHVPPIFGFSTFEQVASSYGGPKEQKSFKKNMDHLQNSLKNIADNLLHQTIRPREVLPNETQIDFKQDLDVLLAEIVRILK